MRWEEILLLADMDGTLLGRDLRIPERNLAAIREFMARGGHFSIATGRSIQSGAPYYRQVQPNAPCILLNGVMLYDFRTETVLRVRALPEGAAQWALKLAEEIPGCGLEAYTARDIFALRDSPALQAHLVRERLPFRLRRAEEMGGPCCKLLFAGEPEGVAQLYPSGGAPCGRRQGFRFVRPAAGDRVFPGAGMRHRRLLQRPRTAGSGGRVRRAGKCAAGP